MGLILGPYVPHNAQVIGRGIKYIYIWTCEYTHLHFTNTESLSLTPYNKTSFLVSPSITAFCNIINFRTSSKMWQTLRSPTNTCKHGQEPSQNNWWPFWSTCRCLTGGVVFWSIFYVEKSCRKESNICRESWDLKALVVWRSKKNPAIQSQSPPLQCPSWFLGL